MRKPHKVVLLHIQLYLCSCMLLVMQTHVHLLPQLFEIDLASGYSYSLLSSVTNTASVDCPVSWLSLTIQFSFSITFHHSLLSSFLLPYIFFHSNLSEILCFFFHGVEISLSSSGEMNL